jgi:hypothetical protein
MKGLCRIALFVVVLTMASFAGAGDFVPDTDGPWINVDVIDLVDYGDATYLEYLGKGYVAMLDALKNEGLILDYGVMMKTTGNASDGDVVIWWSVKTLADYEKAGERLETLSGEIHTDEEWGEIWETLQKVRTIRSTNFYRAVLWNKAE